MYINDTCYKYGGRSSILNPPYYVSLWRSKLKHHQVLKTFVMLKWYSKRTKIWLGYHILIALYCSILFCTYLHTSSLCCITFAIFDIFLQTLMHLLLIQFFVNFVCYTSNFAKTYAYALFDEYVLSFAKIFPKTK